MYQISCDGYILHDVRLPKEYRVLNPVCSLEVNTAGSLTFKIPPNHPYYSRINKLTSVITLTQDGEWLFSGRVLNDEKDFHNVKTVEVEGELSYLVDSNQRTAEYHNISVSDYFTTIISKHNAMVGSDKQFTVGTVNVTDPNDSLYRFSNYENSWITIKEKLIDRLGGYVRIRHVGTVKYIDYITDYAHVNDQTIDFGKNLLDLKQYVNGEDIITAIIPLGARLSTENSDVEERLTIKAVNDNVDYVYDQDSVTAFGWIFDTVIFDDVTVAENLKTKGLAELAKRKLLSIRLELSAIDLHLIDVDIEKIKLGDTIKVVSTPHDLNQYMTVTKLSINLEDPAQNKICLGASFSSLTDITNNDGIKEKVEQAFEDYGINTDIKVIKQEIRTNSSEISRTTDSILLKVSEDYASKDSLSSVKSELSSQMEVNASNVTFKFDSLKSETEEINGIITANQELLQEYIRFQGALIELGRVGNAFTAKLSNTRLEFCENNIPIAYVSNQKLYITDVDVKNKLSFNTGSGFFDFIPRQSGNLSVKWRVV